MLGAVQSFHLYDKLTWFKYSDLVQIIHDLAISAGASIQFGVAVDSVDPHGPSVTLANGEIIHADLVIGADGYRSMCQQIIETDTGEVCVGKPSGTVVYRWVSKIYVRL